MINLRKIVSLLLVCVLLVGSLTSINVFADAGEAKLEIVSNNVLYGETLNLAYAVKTTNLPDDAVVTLTIYDADGNVLCGTKSDANVVIDGADCLTFIAKKGVSAQNIANLYYAVAVATVDGEVVATSDRYEYSVLEYLYERLIVNANEKDDNGNSTVSDEQKAMYTNLITYAKSAEIVLTDRAAEDRIDQYVYVAVTENGAVKGTDTAGIFKKGDVVKPETDLVAESGKVVVWSYVEHTNGSVSAEQQYSIEEADAGITVETHTIFTPKAIDADADVLLATFQFGANGAATHKDGSSKKTDYSEEVDGYELKITNGTNMYPSSYDAKGNSCIKFGSSSATGSCTFTVAENVTSVVIRIAKYKSNTTKITVNGTDYTLTKNSNDGAYDEIVVDTSTEKTVTISTVTGGVRAMMDSIAFWGEKK